jgi:hypothetical protein
VIILLGVIAVALVALVLKDMFLPDSAAPDAAQSSTTPRDDDAEAADAARISGVIDHPVLNGNCTPFLDDQVVRSEDGESVVLVSHGFGLVHCVLEATDAPDSVYARMEQTRPVDGTLTAEWPYVSASWTFNGVDELRVVLEYSDRP